MSLLHSSWNHTCLQQGGIRHWQPSFFDMENFKAYQAKGYWQAWHPDFIRITAHHLHFCKLWRRFSSMVAKEANLRLSWVFRSLLRFAQINRPILHCTLGSNGCSISLMNFRLCTGGEAFEERKGSQRSRKGQNRGWSKKKATSRFASSSWAQTWCWKTTWSRTQKKAAWQSTSCQIWRYFEL